MRAALRDVLEEMAAQEAAVQADLAHQAGIITVQQEQICALNDALQVRLPALRAQRTAPVRCYYHKPAGTDLALSACLFAAHISQSRRDWASACCKLIPPLRAGVLSLGASALCSSNTLCVHIA